jgi:class 3 adenylate cyclase/tetratricopeptide (TPR) repeat protein
MTCSSCGVENRAGRKYCSNCGARLALVCPACGTANEPDDRFCGECGSAIPNGSREDPARATAPAPSVAERRLVSVLFTDLVGFTRLSESRDAEDVRELLSRYFDEARRIVNRYGGRIEKFIGDAVMAVWGSPVAREDDAERAVRAGLELVSAVAALGADEGVDALAARAGVATGEAAVDRGAEHEGTVIGDLVNTASRVQSTATPGAVFVTEATKWATDAAVAYDDAGHHELKGKAEPLHLFAAVRVVAGRRGTLRAAGLEPPFVGRDPELRLLKDLFHATADEGTAHLVAITGIGGIGKSRLAWEFEKYIDGLLRDVYWHRGRCIPYGEGVAYWALAEMVRGRVGASEEEAPPTTQHKLRSWLDRWCADEEERRWLELQVSQLLGLGERDAPPRDELFSAWRRFFELLAERGPVVLVFEDLQWADAGLLDFIDELMRQRDDRALFVVALARPEVNERRAGWGAPRSGGTSMTLGPLRDADMTRLLDGMVPGLPSQLVSRIRERAEGVPLYAVETVRMLLDREIIRRTNGAVELTDAAMVGDLDVPETLQALIGARLDGLPEAERSLLQHASVLGKTFPASALSALTGLDEEALEPMTASLVDKELLTTVVDPTSPDRGQLSFLQSIVQRVVYETLSRRDRKARHLAIAQYLQTSWRGDEDDVADVVAAHYLEAYESAPNDDDASSIRASAAAALEHAGRRALSLAATTEALGYFDRAAGLVDDERAHVALREQSAMALHIAGDLERSIERFDEIIVAYESLRDMKAAARARATIGEDLWMLDRVVDALARMEDAYATLAGEADSDVAVLAGQLGRMRYFHANDRVALLRALDPIERALEISEQLSLPDVLSDALNTKALILGSLDRPEEGFGLLQRALDVALEGEATHAAIRAYVNLSNEMMQRDRLDAALAYEEAGVALSERAGYRGALWFLSFHIVAVDTWAGRWDDAETRWRRYDAHRDDPAARQGEGADYCWIEIAGRGRGQADIASGLAERFREYEASSDFQNRAFADLVLGSAALVSARCDEALERSSRILAGLEALGVRHWMYKTAVRDALEAAVTLGDITRADEILRDAEAIPPGGRSPTLDATTARFRALVGTMRSDSKDSDVEHGFRAAEGLFRETGYRFDLGRVLLEHAAWLTARRRDEEGRPLAVEASSIFEALRAAPWLAQARAIDAPAAPVS